MLFGVLLPQSGQASAQTTGIGYDPNQSTGDEIGATLSDWNTAAAAATPPSASFAAVICDESQLTTSLTFFSTLGLPFIVGPVSSKALQQTITTLPNVPIFAPLGDDAVYAESPLANRYFCSPNRKNMVAAFQSAINRVTAYVSTTRSKPVVTLALVQNSAEPAEADFYTSVKTGLTFNNGTETPNTTGAFVEEDLDSDVDQTGSVGIVQAGAIVEANVDVVALTGPMWAPAFVDQIEGRWHVLRQGAPPPVYVAMRAVPGLVQDGLSTTNGSFTNRLFAVDVDRDNSLSMNYEALLARLALTSIGITIEPFGATSFNDCLYGAMYATVGGAKLAKIAPTSITETALAQGVALVTQGTMNTGDLTAGGIDGLLSLVSNSVGTTLIGTDVYMGLDPTSGVPTLTEPAPPTALLCFGSSQAPNPNGWNVAGVTYDAMGNASGSINCP